MPTLPVVSPALQQNIVCQVLLVLRLALPPVCVWPLFGPTRAFENPPYLADKCNLLETNVKGATVVFPTSRRAGYTRPLETSDLKKMAQKKSAETVTGRFVAHPDGYGFVIAEDPPLEQDVFVPPNRVGSAVDGDTVRVRLVPSRRPQKRKGQSSLEGEIFAIVTRGRETIVGKLFRYQKGIYVALAASVQVEICVQSMEGIF